MVLHTRSEYVTVRTVFLYWFLRGQGLWGLCVHACTCVRGEGGTHRHFECSATSLVASAANEGISWLVTVVQDTSIRSKYWA
jgi:hypothetical protein